MAKILFTWELGEGVGHMLPYVGLIKKLISEGHEVHYAIRTLHRAHELFGDLNVKFHHAPYILPRYVKVELPIYGYPKILHHAGWDTPNR